MHRFGVWVGVLGILGGCARSDVRHSRMAELQRVVKAPDAALKSSATPRVAARRDADGGVTVVRSVNVGAGSCHLIECPDSDTAVVVDCGTRGASPSARDADDIGAYGNTHLKERAVDVVVTHPDGDHFSLLPELLGDTRPRRIVLGGALAGYYGPFVDWMLEQASRGTEIISGFSPGFADAGLPTELVHCGNADVYVLTVNVGDSDNANSLSLLLADRYGNKVLFAGDAEAQTQASIVRNYGALTQDVDVLTAPHHGSSTHGSNTRSWADHTRPSHIVYSAGLLSRHPKCRIARNYRSHLDRKQTRHPFWCDVRDDGTTAAQLTDRTEYVTELLGEIRMTVGPDAISVSCERSTAC